MLLCYAVPNLTATVLALPGVTGKLPDISPPVPEPVPVKPSPAEAILRNYRGALDRLGARREQLENDPALHAKEIAELLQMEGKLREQIRELQKLRWGPGAVMPLVTPEQLRDLRSPPALPKSLPRKD